MKTYSFETVISKIDLAKNSALPDVSELADKVLNQLRGMDPFIRAQCLGMGLALYSIQYIDETLGPLYVDWQKTVAALPDGLEDSKKYRYLMSCMSKAVNVDCEINLNEAVI